MMNSEMKEENQKRPLNENIINIGYSDHYQPITQLTIKSFFKHTKPSMSLAYVALHLMLKQGRREKINK